VPDASARRFIATIGVVFASIALLFVFDTALAGLDRRETTSHAAADFEEGSALMASGNPAAAAESFRAAWNLDRRKVEYPVSLAAAVLSLGRPADAENLLAPTVAANPTNGQVNLEMARILASERRFAESASYYHRAIYGLWPDDSERFRSAARFELIDLLAAHGSRRELLSELLPIQTDSSVAKSVRRRMGHLFLEAGAPDRAAAIFRELLREDATDADAYSGLAEYALERGSLETARADFASALRLAPGDSAISKRIAAVDSAISLDPLRRGISDAEAYARAKRLLGMTSTISAGCVQAGGNAELRAALDSASIVLVSTPPHRGADLRTATDDVVALAAELWKLTPGSCVSATQKGGALGLLQSKISQ